MTEAEQRFSSWLQWSVRRTTECKLHEQGLYSSFYHKNFESTFVSEKICPILVYCHFKKFALLTCGWYMEKPPKRCKSNYPLVEINK